MKTGLRIARRRRTYAAAALLAISFAVSSHAQSATSSIEGRVVDPSGAVLPGATVTLLHTATAVERTVVTDSLGFFRVLLLPVGVYTVTTSQPGFNPQTDTGIRLTVGETLMLRPRMHLRGVAETVDVSGASTGVDTSRSSVSTTVDESAVQNLPVNGRNFIDFALLTPGVARDIRTGDISFAGQRGTLNSLVVDGVDNNNTFAAQTLGRTGSGRAPYQFSQDAVKEFQVNSSSFPAEYGRAGGAVINVVTKSGTNDVRGSVFEFYRDKELNAINAINALRGLPKSPYHYHQFGGTLGGPLRTGRHFFFVSYDGQRNTMPNDVFLDLPAILPADAASRAAIGRLGALAFSWRRRLDQDVFLIKTDHQLGSRHRSSFRYNHQDFTGTGYEAGGPQNAFEHTGDSLVKTRTMSASWPGQFRSRLFNELKVHYARDRQTGTAFSRDPEATIQQEQGGRRVLIIGRNNFSPRNTTIDRAQVADTLAWALGRHTVKSGFDVQFDWIENYFPGFFSGSYRFPSLAAYENRNAVFYRQDFPGPGTSGANTRPDVREYSLFVQDEWRPSATLTLNGGLRYDLMTLRPPAVRNPDAQLAAAGIDTSRLNADTNNWGPRGGLAWNPRASRYVLRAGGGLFYARTPAIVASALANNGINIVSLTFTGSQVPIYPHIFSEIPTVGVPARPTIFYVERDHADPRLLHFNTAVERLIGRGTSLTLTYLHVTGRDLPRSVDRNLGALGEQTLTIAETGETVGYHRFDGQRPFTNFDRVIAFEATAESRYNGLTVDLRNRSTEAVQFRAAYTLGNVVDTAPDATAVASDDFRHASNPVDFDADRTAGDNDRRHRLVTSVVYRPVGVMNGLEGFTRALASGWTFSAIMTAESGRPFSARMIDFDLNNDGNRFNDLAPGTRRNEFRLPPNVTLDMRIARDVPLPRRARAQLIWEAFNLLNDDNITAVTAARYRVTGSILTRDPAFGEPRASAGERIMQLALRVTF